MNFLHTNRWQGLIFAHMHEYTDAEENQLLYPTEAIHVAHNNNLNLKRSTEFFLDFNWVMQGYTDLLVKCKAEGQ